MSWRSIKRERSLPRGPDIGATRHHSFVSALTRAVATGSPHRDVIAEHRAELRRVSREQRRDPGDAERAAELAEEVVQPGALRKLRRRELGQRDRGERHEHQTETDAAAR